MQDKYLLCLLLFQIVWIYFKVTNFLKDEHKLSETLVLSQLKLSILFGDESHQLSFSKTYLEMQLPEAVHTPFSNKLVLSVWFLNRIQGYSPCAPHCTSMYIAVLGVPNGMTCHVCQQLAIRLSLIIDGGRPPLWVSEGWSPYYNITLPLNLWMKWIC